MESRVSRRWRRASVLALACGLAVASGGCELDKQGDPDLAGPSDAGVSVQLLAFPDTVNADGVSTSRVRLVVRNQTGQPRTGLSVLFTGSGDATITPSAASTFVGPVQEGLVMATDSNGEAEIIMIAGTTSNSIVRIEVRPYGIDVAYTFFRSIDILLF